MEEKVPPNNIEAELSVLGSLMIDKDAIIKVADILTPDDFYKEKHAIIFEEMLSLFSEGEPIDVVSLANKLDEKKNLDKIGGRSFLVELAGDVPTSANVIHYAKIVQKKSLIRKLISASSEITELAYDGSEGDADRILDNAEQKLFSVSQKYMKQNAVKIKDVLAEAFDRIDELHKEKGKLRGIPTGYKDLDGVLAGLQKSDLLVLAARPGMGKTTFALDLARNVAVHNKTSVGIFSLEMSKEQLVDRLLCSQSNVDLWKIRTGKLSDSEDSSDFSKLGEAMGVLSEAPIYIDDSPGCSIMEIRTKARRLHMEHKVDFLIVDYLQLMEGSATRGSDNRVQEVSEISRALKSLARELNVPLLALSQLSRAVENRPGKVPQLADLRESGSIEQDADIVMFIYRKGVYEEDLPPDEKSIAEIQIKKHRNGPTGACKLFFDDQRVTFRNLEQNLQEF